MREILFRGKRIDDGVWVYGHYVHQYDEDMIYLPDGIDKHGGFDCYKIVPETVGQFTGLTDMNGEKIFEGDVIETYSRKYVVTFSEERGGYFPFACDDGCGCCSDEVEDSFRSKIIGNIHDNPESFKEAHKNE